MNEVVYSPEVIEAAIEKVALIRVGAISYAQEKLASLDQYDMQKYAYAAAYGKQAAIATFNQLKESGQLPAKLAEYRLQKQGEAQAMNAPSEDPDLAEVINAVGIKIAQHLADQIGAEALADPDVVQRVTSASALLAKEAVASGQVGTMLAATHEEARMQQDAAEVAALQAAGVSAPGNHAGVTPGAEPPPAVSNDAADAAAEAALAASVSAPGTHAGVM